MDLQEIRHESEENHNAVEKSDDHLIVVGIGASAGGLAALQKLFDSLPADSDMAFVVVTHMDPQRESLLPELLQAHTDMPVVQVRGLVPVEINHVYVLPPNQNIVMTDTHLDLEEFKEPRGRRAPIDYFFRSLAEKHREAIAIILSGGGTDGSVGVKAIKEQGGLLMVQDPNEAEHDSMPRAAIRTGLADVVLPVAELVRKLVTYRRHGANLLKDFETLKDNERETVYRILVQVQSQTGHDFSQYKQTTILRRIQRRLQLHGFNNIHLYLDYLRKNSDESQALFNDMLIGVTNFFRDAKAWQALADNVIPLLFNGKKKGDSVRVWSIGCATGEEAYSLAILLKEYQSSMEKPAGMLPNLQVFASDLDDTALHRAREGLYPEVIEADVSDERLSRFFIKEGEYYRVTRELRDLVLFSNHSVLRDPPFSHQDLISCRNLLIYLQRELQERVFQIFHYALNPERYLFLGNSESAEMVHDLFHTIDKSHRFFQARPWAKEYPTMPALPVHIRVPTHHRFSSGTADKDLITGQEKHFSITRYHANSLEKAAPPSVLIDRTYTVLHLSETAGRYLQLPRGTITNNLLKLVRFELQFELRTALFQAFEHQKAVVSSPTAVQFNGTARPVTLFVRPQSGIGVPETAETEENIEQLMLVFFLEDEIEKDNIAKLPVPDPDPNFADGDRRDVLVAQMAGENQRLLEQIQTTSEEYESANEEMKSANEELQSINEEYRSTTEELETSKEELQSMNEELHTVNAELKNKVEEVTQAHSDMENLMAATDIATLFLDRELQIKRYTPATIELFNIRAGDRGRPLSHLTHKLAYEKLADDAKEVLKYLTPIEREVQDLDGHWLLMRQRPYRTADHRIDGVVLTFVDITARKAAEEKLHRQKKELNKINKSLEEKVRQRTNELWLAKTYNDKILSTIREGLLVLKPDLTVEFASESFYQMFVVKEEETIGRLVYELGNGQWDIPALRTLLEEILPKQNAFNDYRVEHEFENLGHRVMLLNARRMDNITRILLAIEDVTKRH